MNYISSRQNERIKSVCALHTRKGREQQHLFLAQGIRTIATLAEHMPIIHLYITEDMIEQARTITSEDQITIVSPSVMDKISTSSTAAGMVATIAIPPKPTQPLTSGLVCAQITDPGNMGTLMRTAAAMNFKTVIIVEGTDPWSPKVVQATAGTIGAVTIHKLSWPEVVIQATNAQLHLAALVVHDGQPPKQIQKNNTLCIVGNEAHGLPDAWINDCQQRITLTMPGNTESLNAAVAGSIALYLMTTR